MALLVGMPLVAQQVARSETQGLSLNKTYSPPTVQGTSGELTLEAYVTGNVTTTLTQLPVDVVLVLDLSSSMAKPVGDVTEVPGPFSYERFEQEEPLYYSPDYFPGSTYANLYLVQKEFVPAATEEYYEGVVNDWTWNNCGGQWYYPYPENGTIRYINLVGESSSFGAYPGYFYKINIAQSGNPDYWYITADGGLTQNKAEAGFAAIGHPNDFMFHCELFKKVSPHPAYYRLWCEYDSKKMYLTTGSNTTTPPTNVNSPTTTIHNGTLYRGINRITALEDAAKSFVDIIAQNAQQYGVDHRVSIVKFSDGYYGSEASLAEGNHFDATEVVKNFVDLNPDTNPDGVATLHEALDGLRMGSSTHAERGFKKAEYLFGQTYQGTAPDNRQREVVCFSDGAPTNLEQAIAAALPLKRDFAATVWTMGIFNAMPSSISNEYKFMQYASSNYPEAQSSTNHGNAVEDPIYSMPATDATQLKTFFQTVASQVGAATLQLGEQTVVLDDISEYFQLPANCQASDIKVYTAAHILPDGDPNDSGFDENGYQFGNRVSLQNPDVEISNEGKTIKVKGFDFAANYVATENNVAKGKKLIITIPIQPFGDTWGDDLPTNAPTSGIYPEDGSDPVGLFPIPIGNIPALTWVEAVTSEPSGWALDNIDSPDDLAWLISYVNGYNKQDAHPGVSATITADIDMSEYNWVPIGSGEKVWNETHTVQLQQKGHVFSGTFDGGFHSITGLRNQASVIVQPGLFGTVDGGTVKNAIVADCDFRAGLSGYFGIIADTIRNGAMVYNCEAAGLLSSPVGEGSQMLKDAVVGIGMDDVALGGVVGLVEPHSMIHSCISVAALQGVHMGGIVHTLNGFENGPNPSAGNAAIYNSYAYPVFRCLNYFEYYGFIDMSPYYFGGFAAINNGGIIENCYLRERPGTTIGRAPFIGVAALYDAFNQTPPEWFIQNDDRMMKGLFVGYTECDPWNPNMSFVKNCYCPDDLKNYKLAFAQRDGTFPTDIPEEAIAALYPIGTGAFKPTETPYLYKHADNDVSLLEGQTNQFVTNTEDSWPHFLNALNAWVDANGATTYTKWTRTCASPVNGDYPVLKMPGVSAVACDSVVLHYGSASALLRKGLSTTNAEYNDVVFLYDNETVNQSSDKDIYIGEGVCVLQDEGNTLTKAHVGVTFENRSTTENVWDWHMFSSSLTDSPLGVNYTDSNEYPFSWTYNTPEYGFTGDGFFPAKEYGTNLDYYHHWDYYCYDEPSYHWINFKRNSNSHWHQDIVSGGDMNNPSDHPNIVYENEAMLTPGKGYMMALDAPTFMQAGGTLQNGPVSRSVTSSGDYNRGYNLIGNPYQSILDFESFAGQNAAVLGTTPSYTIFDADQGGYVSYLPGTSKGARSATRSISPLQGFFVYVPANGTVTFANAMRLLKPVQGDDYGGFRGGETGRPAYPLVNLVSTDPDGKKEILVVEFCRPENGGAVKMMHLQHGIGKLYARHEGENMSIAFVEEGVTELPVRFEAVEDGVFTMRCETANGPFRYLHLIDNITGIDHDLLSEDGFSFEGKADDYTSRFRLVASVEAVEESGSGSIADQFAYFDGGTWIVEAEGDMEVYDLTGRLMKAQRLVNAQNSIDLSGLAYGVYLVRVSTGSESKMQKIVVE